MKTRPILICSLGGSSAPVISAIRSRGWDFVLFVVTESEGAQVGSAGQVPEIVRATGLGPDRHDSLTVPADDPDRAFQRINARVQTLVARFPRTPMVFDYTGGTKSMTAAMLQAALMRRGATIQVMTGTRDTLQQVRPGSERPSVIHPDWIRAEQRMARCRDNWRAFGYAEAMAGCAGLLDDLETDEDAAESVRRLRDFHAMSAAFDAWDRFRHAEARDLLRPLAARHQDFLAPWLRALDKLCATDASVAEPVRLADLLNNAVRATRRGRYDDAVARCYRLVEWTGQWRLRAAFGIDPGRMDWQHKAMTPTVIRQAELGDQQGKRTLSGLWQVLDLNRALEPNGGLATFLDKVRLRELHDLLSLRNNSILAHGTEPLGPAESERFLAFLRPLHREVLEPALSVMGIGVPPQLPDAPPPGL